MKNVLKKTAAALLISASLGSVFALESNEKETVLQGLQQDPNFSTFVNLAKESGLDQELSSQTVTVFAPNNKAFETLGKDKLAALEKDPAALKMTLQAHVLQGKHTVVDLDKAMRDEANKNALQTLAGSPLVIQDTAEGLTVDAAHLESTDVDNTFSNGIVHAVNQVLTPASQPMTQ